MPTLLQRLVFQVGPVPNERAFVLSSVSTDGHYISLRPFVKPRNASEEAFPFEWVFAGTNQNVVVNQKSEAIVTQDFNNWFDSNVYLNLPNTHRGEINTTWENWESGCIAETGSVFPAGRELDGVPFFELWQPLDSTRDELVVSTPQNEKSASSAKSIVFKTTEGSGFDGLVVVTGRWAQGFLSKQNDGTINGMNFIRTLETGNSNVVQTLLQYGRDADKFPRKFDGIKLGDVVEANGLKWEVIESYL
ncbi:Hri1p TDEL_0G03700 [Torulaspora delbrueckii]|uniref:Protein HRI1 n=1 Tax=Torulaspora delbrueckii TaxID=4950 RepID=G8ZXX0_TORDE|nr:hypothetical protein TDEL_0G03700 [Torulaspora delbrueckii]CCE93737.1 hypothetical protein TDEL_0G03700 [Torulaspora delbrueckii]